MILATRRGGDLALRNNDSLGRLIEGRTARAAGVVVNGNSVAGIPAAGAAISYAAYAVASLRMRVWRGDGFDRTRVRGTWQARFFDGMPNEREPWVSVWAKTEGCLTARNNAFWLKLKDEMNRVAAVYVLAPDAVGARWNQELSRPEYRIMLDPSGRWSKWLGPEHVLHFRALGDPTDAQSLLARTPIDIYRDPLGAAIAKIKHESSFYENGVRHSLAVTFPKEVKASEARTWREGYEAEHGGLANAHGVRVFGAGATVSTVGLSLADSQFIESVQLSLEDSARIFRVISSLIGGGTQSQVSKPISPEHEMTRWLRLLTPRLELIEGWIQADPDFFGVGARDFTGFDQSRVLRGDLQTEADISLKKVQSGQWLVDEARALDGLPPLPGGLGKIPQIIPVGGGANPVPTPAPEDDE